MSTSHLLLLIAVVCFVVDSFKVAAPVNLFILGWAFAVESLLV